MRDTWARVCEHPDPEFPTFYFHFALELNAQVPKIGRKQYQASVAAIATAAEELAGLLERHEHDIDFARGSRLSFHHVHVRAERFNRIERET